jgi:hypothetical protein
MVQQAEAAYLALKKAPGEESLQQNYTLIRQRAEIWMKNNKFPESFLDALVPPEKVIADDINAGLRPGASGSGVEDPPSDPQRS